MVGITTFARAKGTKGTFTMRPWAEVAAELADPVAHKSKLAQRMFRLARFDNDSREKDSPPPCEVFGVEGDYDGGMVSIEQAAELLQAAGIEAVLFTTARHTPESPRWRVVAPMLGPIGLDASGRPDGRPAAPELQRARLLAILDAALGNILGDESWDVSRCYFTGRLEGVEFKSMRTTGQAIDKVKLTPEQYKTRKSRGLDMVAKHARESRAQASRHPPGQWADEKPQAQWALAVLTEASRCGVWDGGEGAQGYKNWLDVGMALHDASGGSADGLIMWDMWSVGLPNYSTDACASRWSGFKAGGGATLGTLIWHANNALPKLPSAQRNYYADNKPKRAAPKMPQWPVMDPITRGDFDGGPAPVAAAAAEAAGGSLAKIVRAKITARLERSGFDLVTEEEVRYYVDGLIGEQLAGGIVAKGGCGKTTMMIDLGISTALGGEWLGRQVKQGSFVLFSLDDAQADLDGALAREVNARELTPEQIELVRKHVLLISLVDVNVEVKFSTIDPASKRPTDTGLAEELMAGLDGITDIRCIVMDTLRQFAGGTTIDDAVMTTATKAVTRMAQSLKCAAIVAAHMTKQGARDGASDQYAASGSGAFGDNLRFILTLQGVEAKEIEENLKVTGFDRVQIAAGTQFLRMDDTRGSLLRRAQPPTYISRMGHKISVIDAERKTQAEKTTDLSRDVLAAFKQHLDGMAKDDCSKVLKRNAAEVRKVVDALLARGHLSKASQRARVKITEAGLKALSGLDG